MEERIEIKYKVHAGADEDLDDIFESILKLVGWKFFSRGYNFEENERDIVYTRRQHEG